MSAPTLHADAPLPRPNPCSPPTQNPDTLHGPREHVSVPPTPGHHTCRVTRHALLCPVHRLQKELEPSVSYLLQSTTAPTAVSTLRLGLEVANLVFLNPDPSLSPAPAQASALVPALKAWAEHLQVAYIAHLGQRRRSGEAYIIHPVKVACILGQSQMDLVSVVSGLLHDTVEDTALTLSELDALFGVETRRIVEGETKVSKLPNMVRSQPGRQEAALRSGGGAVELSPPTKSDIQAENQRSMIVAMAKDWRIVVTLTPAI